MDMETVDEGGVGGEVGDIVMGGGGGDAATVFQEKLGARSPDVGSSSAAATPLKVDNGGSGDSGTGGADTAQGSQPSPFLATFKIDVIGEKIVSFLAFEDMKALSEVSREALDAVRKTTGFANRARLNVCKAIIQNELLKECTFLWKHVSVDLSLPIEIVDVIGDILEEAESICLNLKQHNMEDNAVSRFMEEVFKRTKNLKMLELEAEIMTKMLHDVFSNVETQQVLGKLECLDIRGFGNRPRSERYYLIGCSGEEDEGSTFQRNFLQLSMVPLSLRKFLFGKIVSGYGAESETDCLKFIPNLVEANKSTLEHLELHLNVWKFEEMMGIRCPNLKCLSLSTSGASDDKQAKIVETFLKNQPPLEELNISLSTEFPISILLTLQGMLMKMKKLHLKAKSFVGRSEPVDWQFLEGMMELKDFALRKPTSFEDPNDDVYGYGEDVLRKLPPAIEKISLKGFQSFWKDDREPGDRNVGELLARFANLKELNLLRSTGAVTDDGLQSIIANCRKLLSLTFSHCHEVSSFGMSGVRPAENENASEEKKTGRSLDELVGLTDLKIRSCPNIEPESLLNVVQMKYLRSFDYYRNVNLSKEFLYQIVRQNPCLERIALNMVSYDHDDEYLNEIKKEVKKIRSRVHLFELLEKTNWEDEDSDSDASSLDDGDNDSNFSGGGYPGQGDLYGFDEFGADYDDSPHDFDEEDDEDYGDFD